MYAKIFSSIFDSTINEHPPHVFKVWVALIAFAQDGDGIVDMTSKALANRVEMPVDSVVDAINILSAPDPMSRCQDHEGRRIIPIPGRPYGWQIVTFAHYRDIKRSSDRRDYMRDYMRGRRASESPTPTQPLTPVNSRKQPLAQLADTASASASDSDSDSLPVFEKTGDAEGDAEVDLREIVVGSEGLWKAAAAWNSDVVPKWGKPRVTPKTIRALMTKHASLVKAMSSECPGWTLERAIRRALEALPGLQSATWFTFRDFFFEGGNRVQKNRRLWTGYYESTHGSQRGAPPARSITVVPLRVAVQ